MRASYTIGRVIDALAFYSLMGVSRRQFASKRTLLSGALSTPFWEFPLKKYCDSLAEQVTFYSLLGVSLKLGKKIGLERSSRLSTPFWEFRGLKT